MQNSMLVFTFAVLDQKYPYWENLVPRLIRICRIQWYGSFNLFFILGIPLLGKFGPKYQNYQIVSLTCNLLLRRISICRIQWGYSVFLVLILNTFFGHIWSNSKWFVQSEI